MMSGLSQILADRRCGGPDERREFILQSVWSMFAEDLGQIPGHRFTRIVEELIAHPQRSSADELGRLFDVLNDPAPERPTHGLYAMTAPGSRWPLDHAVLDAYGWPAGLRNDPLEQKARLAVRHADVIAGRVAYEPFS